MSADTQAEPVTLEAGRYKAVLLADGSAAILRATSTCETCANCGCGEQQEAVRIPAMIINLVKAQMNGESGGLMARIAKSFGGMG